MQEIPLRRLRLIFFVFGVLALSACSAQQARLQSADTPAKTGKAFTENVPTLYESFFRTAVEVDSIRLARQRDTAIRIVSSQAPNERDGEGRKQSAELEKQLTRTKDRQEGA